MLKEKMLLKALRQKEISLNSSKTSHIVSYYILYSFLYKDLRPDDGLVERAETCIHLKKLQLLKVNHICSSCF